VRRGITAANAGLRLDEGASELRAWLAHPAAEATFCQLATAHYSLGRIMERRGKTTPARSEYEAARRYNPKHKDAKQALARISRVPLHEGILRKRTITRSYSTPRPPSSLCEEKQAMVPNDRYPLSRPRSQGSPGPASPGEIGDRQ
jgi:hypothetical protein